MTHHPVRVADPVHGYVRLTAIERSLIDTRVAQRLRYVAQSGLAHLVFPEVRTSRFSHSLGTMHLASRFLEGSLSGVTGDVRATVIERLKAAVDDATGDVGDPVKAAEALIGEGLYADRAVPDADRSYVRLVEQGLRLAALFHDLGHLPFSHDFEYAVEQVAADDSGDQLDRARPLLAQRPGQDALHERIGHDLTFLLFNEVFAEHETEAARISFALARRILETSDSQSPSALKATGGLETPAVGAFAWLHTLIAGELDVDRCDYVLRDARNYGFEFAIYDLQRLIDNLVVVPDPGVENALVPALRPQGQAAVETFLVARARMYQWGVRHHKVAQVGAALRYGISGLLRDAMSDGDGSHGLSEFLADLETILTEGSTKRRNPELVERFATYDDSWFGSFLRDAADRNREDEWLQLICWRARGPRSLWKRAMDFPADLARWNQGLPLRTDLDGRRAWDESVRALRDDGVLVVRHSFAPWKLADDAGGEPESALQFFDDDAGLTAVSRVSSLIRSLRKGWMDDVQVHAFARSDVTLNAHDVVERLQPGYVEA